MSAGPVAVVGAGTMGHGIAYAVALAGFEVRLTDSRAEAIPAAIRKIGDLLQGGVERGKLSQADLSAVATRLRPYHPVPARGADGRWRKADAPVVCGPPPGSPAGYPRWTKRRLRSVGARVPAVTWRYVDDAPVHDPVGQAARRVELSSLIAAPTWCGLHRFSASLLEALEVYDAVGRTPLYEAVELGCVEAARDLVVLGSDVGRRLNTWWAAAHRPLTPWAAALVCSDPARMLYRLTASDTCYGLDLQPDVVRLVLEPLTGYGTAHPMATVKTRSREPAEPESPSWCAREVLRVLATLCRRRVFYYYGHAPAGPGLPHSVALELPFVPSVSDGR